MLNKKFYKLRLLVQRQVIFPITTSACIHALEIAEFSHSMFAENS